jgi:hypothetical protein
MWTLPEADRMKQEDYFVRVFEPKHFSSFIKARVGHDFGTVHVPTMLEKPSVLVMIAVILVLLAFTGWKVYTSSWIGNPWIWTCACVAVFMFAASGARWCRICVCCTPHDTGSMYTQPLSIRTSTFHKPR